eukprot:SAG22_NODE_211_length_15079_cov_14.083906_5_plen_84_part_00
MPTYMYMYNFDFVLSARGPHAASCADSAVFFKLVFSVETEGRQALFSRCQTLETISVRVVFKHTYKLRYGTVTACTLSLFIDC